MACRPAAGRASFVPVIEFRIPVRTATFRRQVQHQPERIKVWPAARILSGICHRSTHLGAVEMVYDYIAPVENAEARDIGVFRVYVGAGVVAGPIGNERQICEPALILVIDQALDG